MEKKDTMLEDFKEFFQSIAKDYREYLSKNKTSFFKIFLISIRYFVLVILCCFFIIPITHLILFLCPYLVKINEEYEENNENKE